MLTTKTRIQIEKEEIPKISFPKNDVLKDEYERKIRRKNLEKAMSLGNVHKIKVGIVFRDRNFEEYEVNTTVWSVTQLHVCLKKNIVIPLRAIETVNI